VDVVTGKGSTRPVFKLTFGGKTDPYAGDADTIATFQATGSQVYFVPDQMKCKPMASCEFSATSSSYSSASGYSASTAASAGVSASIASLGALSASVDAKAVSSGSNKGSKQTFLNKAECLIASCTNTKPDDLTDDFKKAVEALPADFDGEDKQRKYLEFLSIYGTHYYHTSDLGGQLNSFTFIDKSTIESSSAASVSATLEASFGAGPAKAKVSGSMSSSTEGQAAQSAAKSSTKIIADGGEPGSFSDSQGASASWGAWAATIGGAPVPVNKKLKGFNELPFVKAQKKDTAMGNAIKKFVLKNANPYLTTYSVISVFSNCEDNELQTAAHCKFPKLSDKWKKLAPLPVVEDLSDTSNSKKVLNIVEKKAHLTEIKADKLITCKIVCAKPAYLISSEDCKDANGLVVIAHKGNACSRRGCDHADCFAEAHNTKLCEKKNTACSKVPYRVYDAKTDGKVVLIPPKDPNTFKIVCDFACQASTAFFSNEDCFSSKSNPKDPLKGLVTVRHRGLACEEKGCESSSCKREVLASGLCKQIEPKCDSKYVRPLAPKELGQMKFRSVETSLKASASSLQESAVSGGGGKQGHHHHRHHKQEKQQVVSDEDMFLQLNKRAALHHHENPPPPITKKSAGGLGPRPGCCGCRHQRAWDPV